MWEVKGYLHGRTSVGRPTSSHPVHYVTFCFPVEICRPVHSRRYNAGLHYRTPSRTACRRRKWNQRHRLQTLNSHLPIIWLHSALMRFRRFPTFHSLTPKPQSGEAAGANTSLQTSN